VEVNTGINSGVGDAPRRIVCAIRMEFAADEVVNVPPPTGVPLDVTELLSVMADATSDPETIVALVVEPAGDVRPPPSAAPPPMNTAREPEGLIAVIVGQVTDAVDAPPNAPPTDITLIGTDVFSPE